MSNDYAEIIYRYAVMGVSKEDIPGIEWTDNWVQYYESIYDKAHPQTK
jgi:hypothetical protein